VNLRIASATQNAVANQLCAQIDANGGAGTVSFYDGAQPVSADRAITTQRLLATLTFGNPSFGRAERGTINANPVAQQKAVHSGQATWARIADAKGNPVCDCDVDTAGATLNLSTTDLVAGVPVKLTGFTINVPGG
jgi:hypothetical protein